ncbi:MAG TPA: FecR family protein [Bacteroidales bacterium]|nr:FecR family protein [Bacteroidales bacterium]
MANRILIETLLNKYLNGRLTIQERRQFNDLFADDSNEKFFKELIHNHISEFNEENSNIDRNAGFDEIYDNISEQLSSDPHFRKTTVKHPSLFIRSLYFSAAAAVLIGVFLLGRISPVTRQDMTPVIQPSFTEVKSPYGSRSEIKLPDGTSVILNAGSTLRYRNDFNQNNRDLDLYGEAYFKVAKNTEIPLVVTAGYIDVIAVGTEFNIKAYPEENTIETTLIEGKVEIANSNDNVNEEELLDLAPNQKAIFYKGEDEYKLENIVKEDKPRPVEPFLENIMISPKADVEKTIAWTEGRLIFRGESLDNLGIDLQRKYDVKFVFVDEGLKKYRFTGILRDETLEQVMNVIKLTAPIDFTIEGKTVYLFTDPLQLKGFEQHLK